MVRSRETCSGLLCSVVFFPWAVSLETEEIQEHCVGGLRLLSEAALCDKSISESHGLSALAVGIGFQGGLVSPRDE